MTLKLLARDRRTLTRTLDQLKRAQTFLLKSGILVCATKDRATTTLDFTNPQGQICTSIDKQIGSELALLHTAISELERSLHGSPSP